MSQIKTALRHFEPPAANNLSLELRFVFVCSKILVTMSTAVMALGNHMRLFHKAIFLAFTGLVTMRRHGSKKLEHVTSHPFFLEPEFNNNQ
jgi:hypothetical protein